LLAKETLAEARIERARLQKLLGPDHVVTIQKRWLSDWEAIPERICPS
jgi:hypothetical protein